MRKEQPKLISEFYELKVKQLMSKKVWDIPLIKKDAPISHVLSILEGKAHVWVVNDLENKKIVGVITRHNVLRILAPPQTYHNIFSLPNSYYHGTKGKADDIMTKDPITCKPDEEIVDVLQKMIRHGLRRLAVVTDDNIIIGEITLRHLIHKYYRASQYHPMTE